MTQDSMYTRLGSEPGLRAIINDFMDRVFGDVMIGFFFRNADHDRIKQKEYELASAFLGGPDRYTGESLTAAHAKHPIMGGQFARRKQILKETLADHDAPEDIAQAFLDHTESLRSKVTVFSRGDCR